MGVDPGLQNTGWGVIDAVGQKSILIGSGLIRSREGTLAERLLRIFNQLTEIVDQFTPEHVAVEKTFVSINAASTLKLGHARGIALVVPTRAGMPVYEYAPNSVKRAVTGRGHASKEQVAYMVGVLLAVRSKLSVDETDALAVALTHAATGGTAAALELALKRAGVVR